SGLIGYSGTKLERNSKNSKNDSRDWRDFATLVYHELKETGTRLRPPLHSFRARSLLATLPPRGPERRSRKREHNSHFSPLRKPSAGRGRGRGHQVSEFSATPPNSWRCWRSTRAS